MITIRVTRVCIDHKGGVFIDANRLKIVKVGKVRGFIEPVEPVEPSHFSISAVAVAFDL